MEQERLHMSVVSLACSGMWNGMRMLRTFPCFANPLSMRVCFSADST